MLRLKQFWIKRCRSHDPRGLVYCGGRASCSGHLWQADEKGNATVLSDAAKPTNAVGGSFILGLQRTGAHGPGSHQRSWWDWKAESSVIAFL